jgi:hypothetical protein
MIFKTGLKACLFGMLVSAFAIADDADVDNENAPAIVRTLPKNLDTLFMKSGSELKGKISKEFKSEEDGRVYLLFESDSGGLMKIDKARAVRRVQLAKDKAKFHRNLKIAGDDPNMLWELHAWCKKEGKSFYKDEMLYLLQRIVELDEHDEPARRGLVVKHWLRAQWHQLGASNSSRFGTSARRDSQRARRKKKAVFIVAERDAPAGCSTQSDD